MAFHLPTDVHTRQNRASTAPGPVQPSFPRDAAIPPSLIPGYKHRQTISVTNRADGLLFPQPDRSQTGKVSATVTPVGGKPEYYYVSPSAYRGRLTPPPPPPLPPQQQAALPPRPPKAPIISPSTSPILPPKPPPFLPSIPSYHPPFPRSKSQPPPPLPRGASPPFNSPPPRPPPPVLPPKPHAGRSTSVIVTPSYLRTPSAMPREKPSPDTSDTASLILPSLNSPAESPLEPPVTSEEEELELALKLSAHEEREYTESLLSQDEELARALEESLLDTSRPQYAGQQSSRATTSESSRLPRSSSTTAHPYSPKQSPPFPLPGPGRADSSTSLTSLASGQLKEDEAYARKLAAEIGYDSGRSTPTTLSNHNVDSMESYPLPSYSDIVNDTGAYRRHSVWGVIDDLPPVTPHLESETTRHAPHVSPTPTSNELDAVPQQTAAVPPQQVPSSSQRPSPRPASLALSLSPSEDEETPESPPTSPQASRVIATPNQYVEPELLYGVCKCYSIWQSNPWFNYLVRD